MGVFSEMHHLRISYREMMIERGVLKRFINNLISVPLDSEDIKNIEMIKEFFGENAILTPTKIDMLTQRDLMYNNSKRFICILNRNYKTGSGYQDIIGYDQFNRVYKRYVKKIEKMICYSTLYSKYKLSNGTIRAIENINRTSVFVQDCDAGKKGMPIREQLKRVAKLVAEDKILMPNLILFTGTGIQLIWLIDNLIMKLNSKVYESWMGIQQAIYKELEEAGLEPDDNVFDPAYNTRLVDTYNARAGKKLVRGYVLHTERKRLGDFINFYFTELHDVFKKFPKSKEKNISTSGKVIKSPKLWNLRSYAWGMIQDMKLIPILKEQRGETLVGLKWRWRMATIVRFFALIYYEDRDLALKEVEDWWNGLPPSQKEGTSLKEIIRRSRTAERYYREFKENDFDKKKYKRAGLFYKNQTLIDELQLSVEIQMHLNVIKARSYKDESGKNETGKKWDTEYERKRNELRRREKGIKSHAEKKKEKIEAIKAVLRENPNATVREIAEKTGYSIGTVQNYKKKIEEERL